jgi:hypothetical protein
MAITGTPSGGAGFFNNFFGNIFGGGSSTPPAPQGNGQNSQSDSSALFPGEFGGSVSSPATYSGNQASEQATGQITNTMNQGQSYLDNANNNANTPPTTPPPTTPPPTTPPPTPEDTLAHEGQTQYFNVNNGQSQWLPTPADGSTPPGYSTQNPMTRTDVTQSVDGPGGITYKQFSDGTYGRFDLSTGGYTQANSADFQLASQYNEANTAFENLKNGILTPTQQSLIDGVKSQYEALIKSQMTMNANITGVQSTFQNLLGMGNNPIGQGVVTQTVNAGIDRINDLQAKEAAALADMQSSFQSDDVASLKNAFDEYTTSQQNVQKTLEDMQAQINEQQTKQDAAFQSYALQQSAKYGDAGILPTDTPTQVDQKKAQNSAIYQQEVKTKTGQVDADVLDGMLSIYNKTGTIPAGMGNASLALKTAFYAAIGGNHNLVDQASLNSSAIKAAQNSLNTQQTQLSANQTAVTALKPSIMRLQQYVKPLVDTGSPLLNKPLRDLQGQVLGANSYTAFENEINVVATEYAKILSGASASIGGVSVSSVDDVEKALNDNVTLGQLNTELDAINQDVNARLVGQQGTVNQLQSDIYQIGQNESTSGSTAPSASAWQ